MDGSSPLLEIIWFAVLFIFNIIVYGYSAAIQNISEVQLEEIGDRNGKLRDKIIRIIEDPHKFINTVQSLSMLMNIFAGAYELKLLHYYIRYADWNISGAMQLRLIQILMFTVIAFLMVFLLLTFSVLLPKRIGNKHPVSFAVSLTNITYIIMILLTPLTFMVHVTSGALLKIFGMDVKEPEDNVTEEDIISVIHEGHEQGVLLASEAEMINNIVGFGDKEAKDIMTHRKSIAAVNAEMTLTEAAGYILDENNSRFPVFEGDIDNIIGIVTLRDVMVEFQQGIHSDRNIREIPGLIRAATFIPETRKINVLFKNMQSEKIHMAIVVDEYGQTSGIVAMEDILEEIVGNILDEYDEEEMNIIHREDGSFVVSGLSSLEDISDATGIKYDEEYDTLNGYLTSKFERILSNDERPEITVDGVTYKILYVQNRMISSVQIIVTGL